MPAAFKGIRRQSQQVPPGGKMFTRFLTRVGCLLIVSAVFLFYAPKASADSTSVCTAGNLSTLVGATCDIGTLQFSFTGFTSITESCQPLSTLNCTDLAAPPVTDFDFTPVANGFMITFTGGPLSFSSSADSSMLESARLLFSIDILNQPTNKRLHTILTSMTFSGGKFSVSGTSGLSFANYLGSVAGPNAGVSGGQSLTDFLGVVTSVTQQQGLQLNPNVPCADQVCITSGMGLDQIFAVVADKGNSASWDGAPTTVVFGTTTFEDPAPEPNTLLLISTGLLGLGVAARRFALS